MRPHPRLLSLLLWGLAGCLGSPPSVDDAVASARQLSLQPAAEVQARSPSGSALYHRPPQGEAFARHSASLELSLAVLGDDRAAWVWAGRQLGYLGRYRAAVEHFGIALELFGDDAELLRHRGHRHISLRQFKAAERDLGRAWELIADEPDIIEADGLPNEAGIPRSTLKTNILYHLALARYLQGDFKGAAACWSSCLNISPNDDMRVAAACWLANSLRRADETKEAMDAISFVRPQMDILENDSYHKLLLHYRGELSAAAAGEGVEGGSVASPTISYGLAQQLLHQGQERDARAALELITQGETWAAFGFIAAEVDLARR